MTTEKIVVAAEPLPKIKTAHIRQDVEQRRVMAPATTARFQRATVVEVTRVARGRQLSTSAEKIGEWKPRKF